MREGLRETTETHDGGRAGWLTGISLIFFFLPEEKMSFTWVCHHPWISVQGCFGEPRARGKSGRTLRTAGYMFGWVFGWVLGEHSKYLTE
jgi:hypothetical protein